MELEFTANEDPVGVEIVDPIERHRYTLYTPAPVACDPANPEQFLFPVDGAVAITTDQLTLQTVVPIYVRDSEGEMLAEAEHFANEELPSGAYSIEVCAPIKIYLSVESPVSITADTERTRLSFGSDTEVLVGARSRHEHPAGTVTTTDDPADMMAAISTFGSALKTTSPERSYPTLRGHPPTIELGDHLEVPAPLDPPETGVHVELPRDLSSVYVTASLAYYLGADLVPGSEPRLHTDDGFEHGLDTERGFEGEVERVLKQVFFLDCVTRTEGFYQVELHERQAIESAVDLEFEALYEQPIMERLDAYLRVPFDRVEPHLPEWKLTTHVDPVPTTIEELPFVVNDLAVIRSAKSLREPADPSLQLESVNAFLRDEVVTRGNDTGEVDVDDRAYIRAEETDSLEHAWVGERTPIGASKIVGRAHRNRLDRVTSDGDISITIVCNDVEMGDEQAVVDDVYGVRDDLPFDVTIRRGLAADELGDLLASPIDFFHYIGHIEADGIQCVDGKLDVATVDTVGVDAFLLNACNSYNQGMHLIENGAIGGVVTLSKVINDGAARIGSAMARLLDKGFPLRAALNIARDESIMGSQYIVVGDGGLAIAQAKCGTPCLYDIESSGEEFEVDIKTYPVTDRGIGSLFIPHVQTNDTHFLSSGSLRTFDMGRDELERFLQLEDMPVRIGDELRWSNQVDVSSL